MALGLEARSLFCAEVSAPVGGVTPRQCCSRAKDGWRPSVCSSPKPAACFDADIINTADADRPQAACRASAAARRRYLALGQPQAEERQGEPGADDAAGRQYVSADDPAILARRNAARRSRHARLAVGSRSSRPAGQGAPGLLSASSNRRQGRATGRQLLTFWSSRSERQARGTLDDKQHCCCRSASTAGPAVAVGVERSIRLRSFRAGAEQTPLGRRRHAVSRRRRGLRRDRPAAAGSGRSRHKLLASPAMARSTPACRARQGRRRRWVSTKCGAVGRRRRSDRSLEGPRGHGRRSPSRSPSAKRQAAPSPMRSCTSWKADNTEARTLRDASTLIFRRGYYNREQQGGRWRGRAKYVFFPASTSA